jgi:hypothetical protein
MRCFGEAPLTELQQCAHDFTWQDVETCVDPSLCLADEGRCLPLGCTPNQVRCVGDSLQRCASDLTSFVTETKCAPGTCDPTIGGCGARCSSGSYRCNDVHLEQCVDGRWQHLSKCLSRELCDPSPGNPTCREPECGGSLGEQRCSNSSLYRCGDRSSWDFEKACPNQDKCDVGVPLPTNNPSEVEGFGPGACFQCVPGALRCMTVDGNSQLERCPGNGTGYVKILDCPRGCSEPASGARCNP